MTKMIIPWTSICVADGEGVNTQLVVARISHLKINNISISEFEILFMQKTLLW